jgi:hypothetical protein
LAQPARQPAKLAAAKKDADEETRGKELDWRRKTAAPVPAVEAVTREELPSARPRQSKEVLEVGSRSSEGGALTTAGAFACSAVPHSSQNF